MIKVISVETYEAMEDMIIQKTHIIEEQQEIISWLTKELQDKSCTIAGLKEMLKAKSLFEGSDSSCTTDINFDF